MSKNLVLYSLFNAFKGLLIFSKTTFLTLSHTFGLLIFLGKVLRLKEILNFTIPR
ncbi:hypothetical protein SAMN03080617_01295 [Algoriphagus alkaliphilus]|uniref:Uncharacterized protein n=1 Tax=Algoriphagus alkaliphilus TaxID=279824 RepID=A0A1G5WRW1_9BACT|nr:hypothetical protein SAMN03080617_01295 [Algoriphagus alkaliphilus]